MNILYGTGNPAKFTHMRDMLSGLDIALLSLRDMPQKPPEADECGATPLENARIKALAYYAFYRVPVFSCDTGLYFDDLPDNMQPKVHVRQINGRRLTDAEMTDYYAALARAHGGRLTARYRNGICLVLDEQHVYESMDDALSGKRFYLTGVPHPRRDLGFPLDCLSVEIASGQYYYDIKTTRLGADTNMKRGFQAFFARSLGAWTAENAPIR